MKKLIIVFATALINPCFAQQAIYDVTAGEGNGIRFWSDNNYKISMGNTSDYHFGQVGDFSIKTNMNPGSPTRGWTWGVVGAQPVAAINAEGHMQIAGAFKSQSLSLGSTPVNATGLFQLNYSSNTPFTGALIKNSGTGNVSYAEISLFNNIDKLGQIFFSGSNYSANPNAGPSTMGIYSGGAGGISFISDDIQAPIKFATANTTRMTIDAVGNVGIGANAPIGKFHIRTSGTSVNPVSFYEPDLSLFLQNSNPTNGNLNVIAFGDASNYGVAHIGSILNHSTHSGKLFFLTRPANGVPAVRMLVDETGNVGIGTSSPDQKLTVNGKIHATEVIVTATVPTPDYVFETSYVLPDLKDVKSYIDQNKHLPELPSAAEMEKNGINLSEMNMLLLKKIEELTLYLIQQNKQLEAQNQKINEQTERLINLQNTVNKK
ncbi:hypothetical protein BH09BAC3_BH09BAC3_35260 [soil metagenome]